MRIRSKRRSEHRFKISPLSLAAAVALLAGCASSGPGHYEASEAAQSPLAEAMPPAPATPEGYGPAADPAPPLPVPDFAIPPPDPMPERTPAFRPMTQAEIEQQATAERIAYLTRNGGDLDSLTSTGAVTAGVQPASVPTVWTGAATDAPGFAATDYYAGDFQAGAPVPPMPATASPGECFALVRPDLYADIKREYVARPGYDGIAITPAQYRTRTESYVAQESYERLEILPPTYKTVTEQVLVVPPTTQLMSTEPVYQSNSERVLVRPARQVWKPGRGPIERVDAKGQVMCLVEEPAVYRTVARKVAKPHSDQRPVQVPGEYQTITHRVIDRPAQVRRVIVPEQRATAVTQQLISPVGYTQVRVPDQVAATTRREYLGPGALEWRPVLCESHLQPATVRRVQDALRRAGFNPGSSDGVAGHDTVAALNAYQRAHGLPQDRYLNLQTLQSLGVVYD